jgi:hypothetical protein
MTPQLPFQAFSALATFVSTRYNKVFRSCNANVFLTFDPDTNPQTNYFSHMTLLSVERIKCIIKLSFISG